ncbi:PEP-CTERM sorting domain-containing protein [Rubritalea tangerina]|uniref:PEP-CTERM sorting domain-containing protein n=1 Tax=Rubritalea tangerina TaxID=430798 RepID=UPI0036066D04
MTASMIGGTSAVSKASTLAINFLGGRYSAAKLADVSGTAFGIDAGDWTNTSDTPNGSTTLDGVSFTWTASTEWSQANTFSGTAGAEEIYHGYLDDGGSGATVSISGLSAWLGSNTSYTITFIGSGDSTTTDIRDNVPLFVSDGGASLGSFSINQVITSGGRHSGFGEISGLTSDTLFIDGLPRSGSARGGIAGIAIVAVPEPSSTLLVGLGALTLVIRRKR